LYHKPSDLYLLSGWDYRHELLCPSLGLRIVTCWIHLPVCLSIHQHLRSTIHITGSCHFLRVCHSFLLFPSLGLPGKVTLRAVCASHCSWASYPLPCPSPFVTSLCPQLTPSHLAAFAVHGVQCPLQGGGRGLEQLHLGPHTLLRVRSHQVVVVTPLISCHLRLCLQHRVDATHCGPKCMRTGPRRDPQVRDWGWGRGHAGSGVGEGGRPWDPILWNQRRGSRAGGLS
jgi:hypothetical protein